MRTLKDIYRDYLESDYWKQTADKFRERRKNECEKCERRDQETHVHHLTYENLYWEPDEDLQLLCDGCHKFVHGLSKYNPASPLANLDCLFESA